MTDPWRITYPGDPGPDPTDSENVIVVTDTIPRRMPFELIRWFNVHSAQLPVCDGKDALVQTNEEVEWVSTLLTINRQDAHMLVHNSGKIGVCGTLYGLIQLA